MAENDIAGDAPNPLELILERALGALAPFGLKHDEPGAKAVAAITTAIFDAYQRGGADALAVAPWECTECVWPNEPPTPEQLMRFTHQGWRPWDMANVMMPKTPGALDKNTMGFRVRFTRRLMPQAPAG